MDSIMITVTVTVTRHGNWKSRAAAAAAARSVGWQRELMCHDAFVAYWKAGPGTELIPADDSDTSKTPA